MFSINPYKSYRDVNGFNKYTLKFIEDMVFDEIPYVYGYQFRVKPSDYLRKRRIGCKDGMFISADITLDSEVNHDHKYIGISLLAIAVGYRILTRFFQER